MYPDLAWGKTGFGATAVLGKKQELLLQCAVHQSSLGHCKTALCLLPASAALYVLYSIDNEGSPADLWAARQSSMALPMPSPSTQTDSLPTATSVYLATQLLASTCIRIPSDLPQAAGCNHFCKLSWMIPQHFPLAPGHSQQQRHSNTDM